MKYEYKDVAGRGTITEEVLNKLGSEGWELVSVIPESQYTCGHAFFKRILK